MKKTPEKTKTGQKKQPAGGTLPPDMALWHAVAKTVRVRAKASDTESPVGRKKSVTKPPSVSPSTIAPVAERARAALPVPASKPAPKPAFDTGVAAELRRGKHEVEGRIDLHGMTQAEAHGALTRFISRSEKAGRRTLLVITGKGRVTGGVLRRMLPLWLEEPGLRGKVLALTPARPAHGGDGAFYLRLRKAKLPAGKQK